MNRKDPNSQYDRFPELRQRAEAALSGASLPEMDAGSLDDVRRLLSELHIHQIELEMQNEELRQAQIQLAAEQVHYADLYNFAPVAYLTLDKNDIIVRLNVAAAELLRLEPRYLGERPITPYLTSESITTFIRSRQAALEQRAPQICELTLRRRDGTQAIVQARTMALQIEEGDRQLWRTVLMDITHIKQIETELRESQALYSSLVNSLPQNVYRINPQGKLIFINQALQTALGGAPQSEILGKTAYDFYPAELAQKYRWDDQQVLETGKPLSFTEQNVSPITGQTSMVEVLKIPVCDVDGKINGIQGIFWDVTEKNRAEQRIRESEEKFRLLFENMTNGFALNEMIYDAQGKAVNYRYLEVNPAFERLTGIPAAQVVGKTIKELLPSTEQRLIDLYNEVAQTGQPTAFERAIPELGKHYSIWAFSPRPGQFATISSDITEQKKVQDKLRQQAAWMQFISDAVIATDLDLTITNWNDAASLIYGWTAEEALGRQVDVLLKTEFLETTQAEAQNMLTKNGLWRGHLRQQTKKGEHRYLEASVTHLKDDNGKIVGGITVNRDVTERQRSEKIMQVRMDLLELSFALSLEQLMQKALDEIGDLTDSPIGFYHFVEADQKTISLQAWSTRTLAEFCKAEGKGQHYSLDLAGVWVDCVRQGQPVIHNDYASLPHRRGMPEGHAAILRELVVPVYRSGKIVSILGVGNKPRDYDQHDLVIVAYVADVIWEIVNRKRAEEALQRSLKEKDILMKELQHRAKNSLNVVVSLLDLEMDKLTDERAIAVFENAQARIHSMSSVYEQLYRGGNLDQIELQTYVQRLLDDLAASYLPKDGRIRLETSLEAVEIDLKRALPLGIILNELFTNTLKYAFPNAAPGLIQVTLQNQAGKISLCVMDNGVGLKTGQNETPCSGLGLELVKMLTQQIEGEFHLESNNGTSACVIFVSPCQ